jgi:hypothetical protein
VVLRRERDGSDRRNLWAYLDEAGDLHIDGQDLGPSTKPVSSDGEYEWFRTIRAPDLPRLLEVLGCPVGEDVLSFLAKRYSGSGSYELESSLREGDVPSELHVRGG